MKFQIIEKENISDRQKAIDVHVKLRDSSCTPAALGRLYIDILKQCLWPSQAELAKSLGVSTSILSRSMAIARLPNEITSLIGGPEKITFRLGKRIDDLIEELGIEAVVRNAANLRPNRSRSTHDLLAALENGGDPPLSGQPIRVSLDKSNSFIRIESPYISDIAAHLTVIEDLLNGLIKFTVPANESGKVSNRSRPAALTDRAKAISQHSKFKGKAAAVDYGHFYRAMLNDGVWSSQRQIAVDLGLSRDMVARRIALAQVPDEVATVFGGAESLSLRTAKAIASIMAMIGTEQIRANAAKIPFDAKRSVAKALSFLATGVLPS
jgi:ubiquinone biosynthesis protein UbiJ